MKDYIFVLGRDPQLSMLELLSYLNCRKIEHCVREQKGPIALISMQPQDFRQMIIKLGGTSKIAEVIKNLDAVDISQTTSNKIKYAISLYDSTDIVDLKTYLKIRFRQEKMKATLKKAKRKGW